MKKLICILFFIGFLYKSFGQLPCLSLSTTKTTSLVFPFPISHVDRGTLDVEVQRVREAKNILLVKAAIKDFRSTNITIITSDGTVYGFIANYDDNPQKLVYMIATKVKSSGEYARQILDNEKFIHGIADKSWGIKGRVAGIYIKDNTIYYKLSIDNKSPLDYDIGFIRFYLEDKKSTKRIAEQEIELFPVSEVGNSRVINSYSGSSIVLAFKKFTIPESRCLAIDINEESGGRNLRMKVSNKKLIKAKTLPDLE